MFWKKKKKESPKAAAGKKPSREEIIAQARKNAAAARAEIGDETLEKIKEAMLRKQNDPFEQAKAKVKALGDDEVRGHLRSWLREDEDKK